MLKILGLTNAAIDDFRQLLNADKISGEELLEN